jgi:hypothetical protein
MAKKKQYLENEVDVENLVEDIEGEFNEDPWSMKENPEELPSILEPYIDYQLTAEAMEPMSQPIPVQEVSEVLPMPEKYPSFDEVIEIIDPEKIEDTIEALNFIEEIYPDDAWRASEKAMKYFRSRISKDSYGKWRAR